MTSPSGKPVGKLRLQQSVPRDQTSTETFPLSINTVNNRVKLDNMKTSYFMVQIQTGSCDNLGEVLVSQYCRGCTNSLGVSMTGKGGESLASIRPPPATIPIIALLAEGITFLLPLGSFTLVLLVSGLPLALASLPRSPVFSSRLQTMVPSGMWPTG